MGEIVEFIQLYIEDANLLEEELDTMSLKLVENIQNKLYYGHGRITSNLRDSIQTDFTVDGLNGLVRGYIDGTAEEYGWLVNDGFDEHDIFAKPGSALKTPYGPFKKVHHPGFDGYHFMEDGLEDTVALYR